MFVREMYICAFCTLKMPGRLRYNLLFAETCPGQTANVAGPSAAGIAPHA